MRDWLDKISCRFFGKSCTPERPSSKDITAEMEQRGKMVEASTAAMRSSRKKLHSGVVDALDGMTIDVSSQWERRSSNGRVD